MATTCEHVKRGDLITADFVNTCILDRLQKLEDLVAQLGSGSMVVAQPVAGSGESPATTPQKPVIDRFEPNPAHAGDTVAILGSNFARDPQGNAVTVAGQRATILPVDTGGTRLFIQVPQIGGLIITAARVVLNNGVGTATGLLQVSPGEKLKAPDVRQILAKSGLKLVDKGDPVEKVQWKIDPGDIVTLHGDDFATNPDDNRVTLITDKNQQVTLPVVGASQDGKTLQVQVPADLAGLEGTKSVEINVSKMAPTGAIFAAPSIAGIKTL